MPPSRMRPARKPARPEFSSGPCAKFPGWAPEAVFGRAWLGRSHRASGPHAQIREVLVRIHELLGLPEGYRVGIVPGSDTGAMEMALWNLLGPRPTDVLVWEHFGRLWAADAIRQLALPDCRVLEAPYGKIADLGAVRRDADIVFVWNGTTSGVRVPDGKWIPEDRAGVTICDATSGVFAQDLDWPRLDVTTFSWQKVLGGEAAHGVLVLSPRAVERLESSPPPRGLPKAWQLVKEGALLEGVFDGLTINTPSMLCVADCLLALEWVESIGGAVGTRRRSDTNFAALQDWIDRTDWIENMVSDPSIRSNSSVCMCIVAPWFETLDEAGQRDALKRIGTLLEQEKAAYDVVNHRNAPPGLRVWCGATIDSADIELLTEWLDWAYAVVAAPQAGSNS